jgi:hypothetical protein
MKKQQFQPGQTEGAGGAVAPQPLEFEVCK